MKDTLPTRPTAEQLRAELERLDRHRGGSVFGKVLLILLLVIIVAVAAVILFLPGYVIYGDSMAPGFTDGDMVLAWPYGDPQCGDVAAFHYGERVLIKRLVAGPGDTVDFLEDGTLVVNGIAQTESYATLTPPGASDMQYPVTVPAGAWFALGDNRETSVDSRNAIVGFIPGEQIIGTVFLRVWPLDKLTLYKSLLP